MPRPQFRRQIALLISCFAVAVAGTAAPIQTTGISASGPAAPAVVRDFCPSWCFMLDDIPGAEQSDFDDRTWVPVSLPHDMVLEKKQVGRSNYKGIGWYRRHFRLPDQDKGKVINIDFEGVMTDCDIFLNGEKVTTHQGGYMRFSVDVTGKVKFGQDNLLAVRVSNLDALDSPPGKPEHVLDYHYFGGIYREVTLRIQDPLHITDVLQANEVAGGGIFVTYPEVSANSARVHVKTEVVNERSGDAIFSLRSRLMDAADKCVASAETTPVRLAHEARTTAEQDLAVSHPTLWHPNHPNLYRLVSEVLEDGKPVDAYETRVGIRRIDFKPDGFYVNGEKFFIFGANRHQQFQNIGCAAPASMQRRDAILMRESAFNGVRGHYPNHPAFYDACDELGIVVIEEQPGWQQFTKTKAFWDNTLRDCREMFRRDRNHPSVVLWETSLNETPSPEDWKKANTAVASAEFPGDQMFQSDDFVSPYYNVGYKIVSKKESFLDRDPSKPFITREWGDWEEYSRALRYNGEFGLLRQVVYHQVYLNGDGYDDWGGLDACDRIAGIFKWAWMDHTRGSTDLTAGCGAVDIDRYPKFLHYWFRSMTSPEDKRYGPMVYIADYNQIPDKEKQFTFSSKFHNRPGTWVVPWSTTSVMVFSNCKNVRLYVDDVLVGEQSREQNAATAPFIAKRGGSPYFVFKIPHRGGVLRAEGLMDGKVCATHNVRTPGQPAAIVVTPAPSGVPFVANGHDLLPVYFKVVDANGTVVPTASNEINIDVTGEGTLVGQGLPRVAVERQQVEGGIGFAFVRSTAVAGKLTITATASGLEAGTAECSSVPAEMAVVSDGTHAVWTHTDLFFEPLVAAYKKKNDFQILRRYALPSSEIESVTASSVDNKDRDASKLIDGITEYGTGWLAAEADKPQRIEVTFKHSQAISGVQIFWEKDSTWYNYSLAVSMNGKEWKQVAPPKSVSGQEKDIIKLAGDRAQYFRVEITDCRSGPQLLPAGIAELRFFRPN